MKTFRLFAGCLMAVICLGMLSACDDDEEVTNSSIAGLWETTHSQGWEVYEGVRDEWNETLSESERVMLQLNEDGTMQMWEKTNESYREEGRYELNGNRLMLHYAEDDTFVIKSFDGNTMQLETSESDYYELTTFERR